jgi:hypothetical protein
LFLGAGLRVEQLLFLQGLAHAVAARPSALQRRGRCRTERNCAPLVALGYRSKLRETIDPHPNLDFDPSHRRPPVPTSSSPPGACRRRRTPRSSHAGRREGLPADRSNPSRRWASSGIPAHRSPTRAHRPFWTKGGLVQGGVVDFGPLGLLGRVHWATFGPVALSAQ